MQKLTQKNNTPIASAAKAILDDDYILDTLLDELQKMTVMKQTYVYTQRALLMLINKIAKDGKCTHTPLV